MGVTVVGDWQLSSWAAWDAGDKPFLPLGLNPIGRIHYDANGNMSAVLLAAERPGLNAWSFLGEADTDDKAKAYDTIIAYFGTYEVQADRVIHHVVGASLPAMTGTDVERRFELQGDQLVLSFETDIGGAATRHELIWHRL